MNNLDKRIENLSPAKRALLELRLRQSGAAQSRAAQIRPRTSGQSAPVSFAQQRLWFLDQLEPNGALYNVPRALRLEGNLDVSALQDALNEIARRHEVVRTHFELIDGDVRQIISDKAQVLLTKIDLGDLPHSDREAQVTRLAAEEAAQPFDLAHGPLLRASLVKLNSREHVLLLNNHHIISDGWSGGIFFRELGELYNALTANQPSPLQPLAIQYADFAAWQREWLQGDELRRQLDYWKAQLDGITGILDLPTDYPRSASHQASGGYKFLKLTSELSRDLKELSKREDATLFMTLLAAFEILLWRYSGLTDFVVGSPIAGRNRAEIENLLGFFINTLVLRADLYGDPSFRQLLHRVRENALEAYAHQDLPFEKLVEELQPERDLGRNPLFQVMFQFQNTAGPVLEMEGLKVSSLAASTHTAKFDLMLAAGEEADALAFVMEYSTELFRGETVELMLRQYANLLAAIVAHPDEAISRLPLLTQSEKQQIAVEWNDTAAEFQNDQSIHELFEAQVLRTPHDVALICDSERLTFAELNELANQLAGYLRREGVAPEARVGICFERSTEMIIGLLAILKAGGAYVPLEPHYPAERISFIVENSQAALILTHSNLRGSFGGAKVVCLDEIGAELTQERKENPLSGAIAENAAHVIYTSGSTGQPKGVISPHWASVNRFAWMWRRYPFAPGEVCCQKTALSFVDSIWEIFGPLLQGNPLVIIPDDVVKDPARFVQALSTNKVTRLVLVPSLLRVILDSGADLAAMLGDLRICVCSGEALPVELAAEFRRQLPETKLINLYGSSEVAADVTCFEVPSTAEWANVPIGRPIANTSVYVLDEELQPAGIGVPGELYVGGEGLARGYLNRPDLTAERFIPDPFAASKRLFRTGDVARYLPDGNIEYRGRRDHQVKLRGFRIELGEIEVALANHPAVIEAVVVLRSLDDQSSEDKQLVAYLVANGEPPAATDLRAHLRRTLPDFMIPSRFVTLEKMPLTASGKVNRLALPKPEPWENTETFVGPRTQTEELLANIWAAELKLECVGVNDDFFALGGHSLLLMRIAARIREAFQVELPLRDLFAAATVSTLAERVEAARRAGDAVSEHPLVPVSREGELALSFAQERLWFFDQLEPGSAAYNVPRALRLTGSLNVSALQQSLAAMMMRHEVLRSTFHNVKGKPSLSFSESAAPEVPLVDLSQLRAEEREARVRSFVKNETDRPFDLTRGPMLRLAVARTSGDEHVLVLTMHHIVSDGWSVGIALSELIAGYNAIVTGTTPALPELPVQYVDFAAWQRELLSGQMVEKQIDFWREQLRGAPALINLPADRPRPAARSFRGDRQSLTISPEVTRRVRELARSERATLFMTLLATFHSLLACVTSADDIVVGSPAAGRNHPETENLIGYFVNTLVLRTGFEDDPSFRDVLKRVRDLTLRAFGNQDVPFEKLVDELGTQRSLAFNPLFQVWFVLQNASVERRQWHDLKAEPINIETGTTRHDLQLSLWESDAGLAGALTFSTDLFDAETVACIGEQFTALLASVAAEPDLRLSDLRARVAEVERAFQQRVARSLEEASHQKLRSVKRKTVSERVL